MQRGIMMNEEEEKFTVKHTYKNLQQAFSSWQF